MHHFLIVDHNGHVEPLGDHGPVQARLGLLASALTPRTDSKGRVRYDSHEKSLQMLERHLNVVRDDLGDLRQDDWSGGLGNFNPRDLTYKFRQVLEERLPPLSAEKVFPVNTEVPPGALHYEQYRTYSTGQAVVYRGGSGADVPAVGIGQATFKQNVVYPISKSVMNWLENQRVNMVGLDTQARKMRTTRRVIDELCNRWTWDGAGAYGLYGWFNHPYVDTALSTVDYGTGAADDIAADFGDWANYAENESSSTFQPNTLLIAPKLANKLRNRRYGDNADKSLMDWILSANPHITRVEKVREFNDKGGTGIHAFGFTRSDGPTGSSAEIVMPLTPTYLPPDTRALVTELFMVAGHGGLNQREVGDNLIVYAQVS